MKQWPWEGQTGFAAWIALAVCLGSSPSLAQPKSSPVVREKQAANIEVRVEKLYNLGVAAAERLDWASAEKYFGEALTLKKMPQIAANLADAELRLGKPRRAAEHLDYVLRESDDADADERAEIEKMFADAQRRIVTVRIQTNIDETTIFVDNLSYGHSPLDKRIFLEPGAHTFEAEKDGYRPYHHSVHLVIGSDVTEKIEMRPLDAAHAITPKTVSETKRTHRPRLPFVMAATAMAIGGAGSGFWLRTKADDTLERANAGTDTQAPNTPQRFRGRRGICDDPLQQSRCQSMGNSVARAENLARWSLSSFVVCGAGLVGLGLLYTIPYSPKFHVTTMVAPGATNFSITTQF